MGVGYWVLGYFVAGVLIALVGRQIGGYEHCTPDEAVMWFYLTTALWPLVVLLFLVAAILDGVKGFGVWLTRGRAP